MAGPLSGIRVLDLTDNVLGPYATQLLGDAGADITKVESPGGDPMRHVGPTADSQMGSMFLGLNRNKRSVVLNLKEPGDYATLTRLVADADVFVHCMRPAAARRLAIDYATLRTLNPTLVYGSANGYRRDSDLADAPAYDDVIQGRTGLAAINMDEAGSPRYFPTVLADKLCGVQLASSISMALVHRERAGVGQEVHVPMLDTLVAFNLVEHLWGATYPDRDLPTGYPRALSRHRRPYATSDGHICIMAVNDGQWQRLLQALGRGEVLEDPRFNTLAARTENIDLLYERLADIVRAHTTQQLRDLLDVAEVPNGPVNSLGELLTDPYVAQVGVFDEVEHPTEGRLRLIRPPVNFSQSAQEITRLPPTLGQHTNEVLGERDPVSSTVSGSDGTTGPGHAT